MCSWTTTSRSLSMAVALGTALACTAPKRFAPPSAPTAANESGPRRTAYPRVPARVVIPNFVVTEVDAPYPPADQVVAREYFAITVPNQVEDALVAYGVFSEVFRVAETGKTNADFVLQGQYRYTETDKAKGLAPNETLVRGDLEVSLIDVRSGQEVFRRSYDEERRQTDPAAPRLSPEYMNRIATDLSGQAARLTAFAKPPEPEPVAAEAAVEEAPVARTPTPTPAPARAPAPTRTARPRPASQVTIVDERPAAVAAETAPAAAPAAASADEEVEDWALRMRRGLTEPTP